MKTILYQKPEHGLCKAITVNNQKPCDDQFISMISKNGAISLIPDTLLAEVNEKLDKLNFLECERKSKLELRRSLKLMNRSLESRPRKMQLDFSSSGPFRKSFNPFLLNHFKHNTPACVFILRETLFTKLINEIQTNKPREEKRSTKVNLAEFPPHLRKWLRKIQKNPDFASLTQSFTGISDAAILIQALAFKASQSNSPVILLGESGTGKNVIANLIHQHSLRADKQFVHVNCSAIQESLFEAAFFGHIKGAFTGAEKARVGFLKTADEGTLFLDEIGNLSLENQAKLLIAVDTKKFTPVGAVTPDVSDFRIIAATNSNLPEMVNRKTFRMDLFYRLNSVQILVPSLRERPIDIPIIAEKLWAELNNPQPLDKTFLDYLKHEPWLGNVRELNMVLAGINALFADEPPTKEAIESLMYIRRNQPFETKIEPEPFEYTLKTKYKNILNLAIEIIRGIKVELRPLINDEDEIIQNPKKLKRIVDFVEAENDKLDDLCRHPLLFRDPELYDKIRVFRYDLGCKIQNLPRLGMKFREIWYHDFHDSYVQIFKQIYNLVYEGV